MTKNNPKANGVNQTGLYWPGKRTEVDKVILPFQTVETINESKADREELTLFRQMGEPASGWSNNPGSTANFKNTWSEAICTLKIVTKV